MPDSRESAAPSPLPEISVPLVSLRRLRLKGLQKLQHAIPAVGLLYAGAQGLMRREHGFALALAVGELVFSALLLRLAAKELAAMRRPHPAASSARAGHAHGGVDWFDVFASGVLTVEALEHWHVHHHLPRPTILVAVLTLALGLFHGRFAAFQAARRRVLRIEAAGVGVRGRFFGHFFAPWADIERIDVEDRTARIVARGGKERRIDLSDLPNAAEVRAALRTAQERLALEEGPSTADAAPR